MLVLSARFGSMRTIIYVLKNNLIVLFNSNCSKFDYVNIYDYN